MTSRYRVIGALALFFFFSFPFFFSPTARQCPLLPPASSLLRLGSLTRHSR